MTLNTPMETFHVPQGDFALSRYPINAKDNLRAWDAADEYLLNQLAEEKSLNTNHKLLIINDNFGALTVALADYHPIMISDSYLAHQGTLNNLQENNISGLPMLLDSLSFPENKVDIVLVKIPKSLSMLEHQLHTLHPLLTSDSLVIAAGMVKTIHRSTLALFEKIIGPTKTSLAKRKARLIFPQIDPNLSPGPSPYPKSYTLEGTKYRISNHANVFSRERLDIGTRFLLQHLPQNSGDKRIVDLGCGNGVVGLMAAHHNPDAEVCFVDESYMAIASAKDNFQRAFPERKAEFYVTDCLLGLPAMSADIILNNPPFHESNVVGDHIAWRMFKQSKQMLNARGKLYVIGNRHLGYHTKLKRLFGNCELIASNSKFVILKSTKK